MSFQFFVEDVSKPCIDFQLIKKILKNEILENGYKLGSVNYIFCSDAYLLSLNIKYLEHDYLTDVITFDYTENLVVSGDIFISTDMVLHNSVSYCEDYYQELFRVISHGLLHLLKYNDKDVDDISLMRKKESQLIEKFNEANHLVN